MNNQPHLSSDSIMKNVETISSHSRPEIAQRSTGIRKKLYALGLILGVSLELLTGCHPKSATSDSLELVNLKSQLSAKLAECRALNQELSQSLEAKPKTTNDTTNPALKLLDKLTVLEEATDHFVKLTQCTNELAALSNQIDSIKGSTEK